MPSESCQAVLKGDKFHQDCVKKDNQEYSFFTAVGITSVTDKGISPAHLRDHKVHCNCDAPKASLELPTPLVSSPTPRRVIKR